MSQRSSLLVAIVIAICGTVVLGTDRMIASADANANYGLSMTVFTYIGLALLLIAAIWLFLVKPKQKSNPPEEK